MRGVSVRSTHVGVERGPTGRYLTVSRRIDASPAVVWELLTDTRRWPEWGPSITAVDSADRVITTGSRGKIRLVGGLSLSFEIETCGGGRWTWRVGGRWTWRVGGRWTWRVGGYRATGHRVEPAPADAQNEAHANIGRPERCRAVFEIPLLAAPYGVVCARALSHLAVLASRDHGSAGESVIDRAER